MATIKNLRDKWKAIKTGEIIHIALEATQPAYVELQKAQMHAGKTVDGSKIGAQRPYASKDYANQKNKQNPLPGIGNPDLYLHGDFYDGIKTTVGDQAISLESTDDKGELLDEKYPGALAGLGGEYKEKYQELLQKTIVKYTNNGLL